MRLFLWNLISATNPAGRPTLIVASDLEDAQRVAEKALFDQFREFADDHEQAMRWTIEARTSGKSPVTEIRSAITWHSDGAGFFAHVPVDGKTCLASKRARGIPE